MKRSTKELSAHPGRRKRKKKKGMASNSQAIQEQQSFTTDGTGNIHLG